MGYCMSCRGETPHKVVFGACRCTVWPLAMPEASLRRPGRCGRCGTRPEYPFSETPDGVTLRTD